MSQANHDLIPIRRPVAPSSGTIYLPEIYHRTGNYLPQTDLARSTMAEVVDDIAQGQIEAVVRVLAINVGASECWDASSAVAATVLSKVLAQYNAVPAFCEDFLETHLGVHNVRDAEHEVRHAA